MIVERSNLMSTMTVTLKLMRANVKREQKILIEEGYATDYFKRARLILVSTENTEKRDIVCD